MALEKVFKIHLRTSNENTGNSHSLTDKPLTSLGQLIVQKLIFRIPLRKSNERNMNTTVRVVKLRQVSAKKICTLLGSINR